MRLYNGRCVYCSSPVVYVKQLVEDGFLITWETHDYIFWEDENGWTQGRLKATVDHVEQVARGGSNEIENLKLACVKCNESRGKKNNENKIRRNPRWR
jgi:hypothetical protein